MSWQEISSRRMIKNKYEQCRYCVPPDRHVGCRDTCEGWILYQKEKDADYAQRTKDLQIRNDSHGVRKANMIKNNRKTL